MGKNRNFFDFWKNSLLENLFNYLGNLKKKPGACTDTVFSWGRFLQRSGREWLDHKFRFFVDVAPNNIFKKFFLDKDDVIQKLRKASKGQNLKFCDTQFLNCRVNPFMKYPPLCRFMKIFSILKHIRTHLLLDIYHKIHRLLAAEDIHTNFFELLDEPFLSFISLLVTCTTTLDLWKLIEWVCKAIWK